MTNILSLIYLFGTVNGSNNKGGIAEKMMFLMRFCFDHDLETI